MNASSNRNSSGLSSARHHGSDRGSQYDDRRGGSDDGLPLVNFLINERFH